MAAIDIVNRVLREFRRYTGDGLPNEPTGAALPVGDPSSGVHNPKKSELREALLAPVSEAEAAAGRAEEARDVAIAAVVYNPVVVRFTTTDEGPYDMGEAIGSANLLDVKIGGVWQDHDKYTVDGTTFTLTDDPGAGLPMEAIIRADVRQLDAPGDGSVVPASFGGTALAFLDDRYGRETILPTICLTFDFYENAMSQAKPIMDLYGLTGTYFVDLSTIDDVGGPTFTQLTAAKAAGWEIGAYTGTNWVTAEAANRDTLVQLAISIKNGFYEIGLPVVSLAPNQRAWNLKLRNLMDDGVFERVRVVDNYFTNDGYFQELPVPDLLWVKDGGSLSLTTADTGESLVAQVDELIELGGLWTVVIHNVSDTGDTNYRVTPAAFNLLCNKIQNEVAAGRLRIVNFRDIEGN